MLDVSYLYDPIRNRYKGVYANRNPDYWDAIPFSPDGKLTRRGTFPSQQEAAQAVATFYRAIYGNDWTTALEDRKRRHWRIRRISARAPARALFTAEVRLLPSEEWYKVTPLDLPTPGVTDNWSENPPGWLSSAAALVAIRIYRFMHPSSASPCPAHSAHSSTETTAQHSSR